MSSAARPVLPELGARWTRVTEWPMAGAAVLFLVAYSWDVIADLRPPADDVLDDIMTIVWIAFAVDYLVRLATASGRGRWFVRHLWELPIIALPFLRPLRLLRLVTLVRILHQRAGTAFRGRVTVYVVTASALLVYVGAVAELDAEQNVRGSNIRGIGDALWWAFETITTVGYGDRYPVTLPGRLVAVGLMIAGVALIGSVTATVASWLIEQVAAEGRDRDTQH